MRAAWLAIPDLGYTHSARCVLWLAAVLVIPGGAQVGSIPKGPFPQPIGQRAPQSADGLGGGDLSQEEERLQMLNRQRQKSLVSDTNKLLKLASELDGEVKNANPQAWTPSQLRKLAEIEKLAHNVKDKMSYSMKGPAVFQQATPMPVR
jgi:hypothetical protein